MAVVAVKVQAEAERCSISRDMVGLFVRAFLVVVFISSYYVHSLALFFSRGLCGGAQKSWHHFCLEKAPPFYSWASKKWCRVKTRKRNLRC
jgi:hypothetical protein